MQQGYLGRATRSLFQQPLLSLDEKTLDTLEALHPKASEPVPEPPEDAPQPLTVDPEELHRVARRMANGSAPAASGWTGELIRALIDDNDCFAGLSCIITDIINGVFADNIRDVLLSGLLVAARKSSGAPTNCDG